MRSKAILSNMRVKNQHHLLKVKERHGISSPQYSNTHKLASSKESDFDVLEETLMAYEERCAELEQAYSARYKEGYLQGERVGLKAGRAEFIGTGNSLSKKEREKARDHSIILARKKWPHLY